MVSLMFSPIQVCSSLQRSHSWNSSPGVMCLPFCFLLCLFSLIVKCLFALIWTLLSVSSVVCKTTCEFCEKCFRNKIYLIIALWTLEWTDTLTRTNVTVWLGFYTFHIFQYSKNALKCCNSNVNKTLEMTYHISQVLHCTRTCNKKRKSWEYK